MEMDRNIQASQINAVSADLKHKFLRIVHCACGNTCKCRQVFRLIFYCVCIIFRMENIRASFTYFCNFDGYYRTCVSACAFTYFIISLNTFFYSFIFSLSIFNHMHTHSKNHTEAKKVTRQLEMGITINKIVNLSHNLNGCIIWVYVCANCFF